MNKEQNVRGEKTMHMCAHAHTHTHTQTNKNTVFQTIAGRTIP